MGVYGSCTVERKNDLRWKLSDKDIITIKKMQSLGHSINRLAKKFGVSRPTISYWTDSDYRERQRIKNAKRRRTKEEEKLQVPLKQRRRHLVRDKVRAYTRKQNRAWRARHLKHVRKQAREYIKIRRIKNPEYYKRLSYNYWHKYRCKCKNGIHKKGRW